MSAIIIFMPNKMEKAVRDHFHLTEGYTRSTAKKYATVFGQIYYWCTLMPDGFYKYKQPCPGNPLYREGDSWEESLSMTKAMFNPIFDKLVNCHKSKTAYMNSTDKFQGKMFCSYMECGKGVNKTYYFMNKELVNEFLESIKAKLAGGSPSPIKSKTPDRQAVSVPSKSMNFLTLGAEEIMPLLAGARQTAFNTQTTTSLSSDAPENDMEVRSEKEFLISSELKNSPASSPGISINEQMLAIFNKHTGRNEVRFKALDQIAADCLANEFCGSLDEWDKHCELISRDDFAMGRTPTRKNFQIWFKYAICEASIVDIRNKHVYVSQAKPTGVNSPNVPTISTVNSYDAVQEINSLDEPEIVKNIRKDLLKAIGDAPYKSWLSGDRTSMKIINGELVLNASSEFIGRKIIEMYERVIKDILKGHSLLLSITFPQQTIGKPDKTAEQSSSTNFVPPAQVKAVLSGLFKKPKSEYQQKYPNPNDDTIEAKKAEWIRAIEPSIGSKDELPKAVTDPKNNYQWDVRNELTRRLDSMRKTA